MATFAARAKQLGIRVAELSHIAGVHTFVCYATPTPLLTLHTCTSPSLLALLTDDVFTAGLENAVTGHYLSCTVRYCSIKQPAAGNRPQNVHDASKKRLERLQANLDELVAAHPGDPFICYIRSASGNDLVKFACGPCKDIYDASHWGRVAEVLEECRPTVQELQLAAHETSVARHNTAAMAPAKRRRSAPRAPRETAAAGVDDLDESGADVDMQEDGETLCVSSGGAAIAAVEEAIRPAKRNPWSGVGSAVDYREFVHFHPAAYCIPLTRGKFALPDVDVLSGKASGVPVQVGWNEDDKPSCTCRTFRDTGGATCYHTSWLQVQLQLQPQPDVVWREEGQVVPIVPRSRQGSQLAAYYWVHGTFVHKIGDYRFSCGRSGDGSACRDIAAVKVLLNIVEPDPVAPAEEATIQPPTFEAGGDDGADEAPVAGGDVRYPFPPSKEDYDIMHCLHKDGPPAELRPSLPDDSQLCRCGLQYCSDGYALVNARCPIFCPLPIGLQERPLYELHCPNRQSRCTRQWAGRPCGLFMYSPQCVMALKILYDYLMEWKTSARKMGEFWLDQSNAYQNEARPPAGFCSETQFRRVCARFRAVLAYTACFVCPVCRSNPDVILVDGTAVTLANDRYDGTRMTKVHDDMREPLIPRPHDRNGRMFCPHKRERQLLKQFVQHFRGKEEAGNVFADGASTAPMQEAISTLNAWLATFDAGDLLLQLAGMSVTAGQQAVQQDIGHFLKCLASPSPVCSYMPVEAAALVGAWLSGARNIAALPKAKLAALAPVTSSFIAACAANSPGSQLSDAVVAVLCKLVTISASTFSQQNAQTYPWDDYLSCDVAPSSSTDKCLETGVCCGLPQVRRRPLFAADKDASDKQDAVKDRSCSHAFVAGSRASRRTGGLFIFMCEHGIVYCFFILGDAEGRDEAFSFLYQYFKVMPRLIVYDFACALHEFALNRCPYLFSNTTFAVDRFHWCNHKSCAISYSLNTYARYSHINSQAVEQINSVLQKIKPCVAQMTQENFMFYVRLFIGEKNEAAAQRLLAVNYKLGQITTGS